MEQIAYYLTAIVPDVDRYVMLIELAFYTNLEECIQAMHWMSEHQDEITPEIVCLARAQEM